MPSPIDIFAEGARDGVYPGGQLAASRECQRLVTAAVGVVAPGLEPATNNTVYDLASLTKPLAATVLIGRAVERGLCRFEDPIAKFVPDVDPAITIEGVLTHSSGLPAHARFDLTLPAETEPGTWDAWRLIIARAAEVPRAQSPGSTSVYSDLGFILLGAALEVIYQQPISTAFALLGTPLFFRDRRGPPALPVAPVHATIAPTEDCRPGFVHDENCRAMGAAAGHAGLFGTASGVLKVAENLVLAYHGWSQGLLQPATVRRLWQGSGVPGSSWAHGWDRPSSRGSSTGGRWPRTSVGHLGFTGTSLWIEPERGLIVVLVTNRVCPTRANNMIRRLRPALYDAAWSEWGSKADAETTRPRGRQARDRTPTVREGPPRSKRSSTPGRRRRDSSR